MLKHVWSILKKFWSIFEQFWSICEAVVEHLWSIWSMLKQMRNLSACGRILRHWWRIFEEFSRILEHFGNFSHYLQHCQNECALVRFKGVLGVSGRQSTTIFKEFPKVRKRDPPIYTVYTQSTHSVDECLYIHSLYTVLRSSATRKSRIFAFETKGTAWDASQ